jgi:flagella basal body P-ring formation protein FlgA
MTIAPTKRAAARLTALVCSLGLGISAAAQTQPSAPAGGLSAEWMAVAQGWVEQAVAAAQSVQQASPLRFETVLGEPDSRLRLAPCARVEPFVPPGTRLWGKTRLGLRCAEGVSRWSIFLPLTVKAFGPAWVVRGELAAGAVLKAGDAMQAEVDWAQEPSPILATPAQWLGQVAVRTLGTGQALRQTLLRPAQVFQAGSQVRVLAQGAGFQVVSDGLALSAGVIGQPARVRMDNGRVMSGLVSDHKTVQLDL